MSGRSLGRLLGSLLFVSALAAITIADSGLAGLQLQDFVWQ